MNRNQEIATTIATQLGGLGRLKAMCGAKDFVAVENGLQMKLPSNMAKCMKTGESFTHLVITLTPADLYRMESVRCRMTKGVLTRKVVRVEDGVYNDSLCAMFEDMTGMYLSLGRAFG